MEEFFKLLIYFVLLPVMWLLATPFILVAAVFMANDYKTNVKKAYGKITKMWDLGDVAL